MDEKHIEMAERFANEERDASLAKARQAMHEVHPDFDGTHCVDCNETIPAKRRAAMRGCCRCTPCQEALERQRKLGLVH